MITPEGMLSAGNLEVGEWKDNKGKMYVSISRTSGYRKTIAIPLELVQPLMAALENKERELEERVA